MSIFHALFCRKKSFAYEEKNETADRTAADPENFSDYLLTMAVNWVIIGNAGFRRTDREKEEGMAAFKIKTGGSKLIRSYFLTYLIVLLIPILTASVFYYESIEIIRRDIENENSSLLRQAAEILDVRMQELEGIGTQLIHNSQITSLRNVESPLEYPNIQYFIRARDTLPEYTAYNDFLSEYFLFYNKGQLAFNDRIAYTYRDFYDLYMHNVGQLYEDWLTEMRSAPASVGGCRKYQVQYFHNGADTEKTFIAFSYSFMPFNDQDGMAVLFVDQENFLNLLSSFGLEEDEIALIESGDGLVLAATTEDEQAISDLQSRQRSGQTVSHSAWEQIRNREMLISSRLSARNGCRITIARPADRVYARIIHVLRSIAIALAVVFVLGLVFCYWFSRRNSVFLHGLALGSGNRLSGMTYSEAFRSLKDTFQDIQSANDTMTRSLAVQKPYLQATFLSQLIDGDLTSEENAVILARSIDAFQVGQPMCVVLFHFSGSNPATDTMERQFAASCKNVIGLSVQAQEQNALQLDRSEDDFVLLMMGRNMEQRIRSLVYLIRSNLPESINGMLFVYVGNTVDRLTDVVRSWDHASSMIYIQPSPAEVPVMFYKESENARAGVFFPQDLQHHLIGCMMNGDKQSVLELLSRLKEQNLKGEDIPPYMRQLFIDSLINTLLKINTLSGLPQEKKDALPDKVKALMALPVDEQLHRIDGLYTDLCRCIQQFRSGKLQMMDDITAYLKQHYMDAGLSLAMVADQFHVSESYLSYTFKEQTGTNFFSFVEAMRIEQAKKLLRQTNLKISEIAEQIGYASANSFCRAFKRSTGNSATNYRSGLD